MPAKYATDRERGLFTATDLAYVYGVTDYPEPQENNRRMYLRNRLRNALLDLTILLVYVPKVDLDAVLDDLDAADLAGLHALSGYVANRTSALSIEPVPHPDKPTVIEHAQRLASVDLGAMDTPDNPIESLSPPAEETVMSADTATEWTTMAVTEETLDRARSLKRGGESYNDLLLRLLANDASDPETGETNDT